MIVVSATPCFFQIAAWDSLFVLYIPAFSSANHYQTYLYHIFSLRDQKWFLYVSIKPTCMNLNCLVYLYQTFLSHTYPLAG